VDELDHTLAGGLAAAMDAVRRERRCAVVNVKLPPL
jgi:hypothetical protein